jgi:hypothetical protein
MYLEKRKELQFPKTQLSSSFLTLHFSGRVLIKVEEHRENQV